MCPTHAETHAVSFLTHSFFSIIFPVHILLLRFIKPDLSTKEALKRLRIVVAEQVRPHDKPFTSEIERFSFRATFEITSVGREFGRWESVI